MRVQWVRHLYLFTIIISVFCLSMSSVAAGNGAPADLLVEYRSNPQNIDITQPRFSWMVQGEGRGVIQSAYQIIVSSSLDALNSGRGDMWDSGKVRSDESVNVAYAGKPFQSGGKYFWKVRTWDNKGNSGEYSDAACFETGLLNESDWQGEWIGHERPKTSVEEVARGAWGTQIEGGGGILRKEFTVSKSVARARAYVSGIGYYELRINGGKVGNLVLDPIRTNYLERVFYSAYDVTEQLKRGENAAGIMLAQGWYLSTPRAILQLNIEYTDGTTESVVTDGSWKSTIGPIVQNSIYHGETYDARKEEAGWDMPGFSDAQWKAVSTPGSPGGKLTAQVVTPIKVTKTFRPAKLTQPYKDVWVYDMGQNLTGWVQLAVEGPAGTEVKMEFAELLYPEGTINDETLRSARAEDVYILKGEGQEVYEPRFTYHGFRYVQVTGFPGTPTLDNIRCRVVWSAVDENWPSRFSCSNELFNRIQHAILWGQLSNLNGYPMDCPQRDERQGWAADGHVTAEEAIYNFDMGSMYTKWTEDIFSNQEEDGLIPDISPTETKKGVRGDDASWDSYCILIPWYVYLYFNDTRILERHYDGMKKYVNHLTSKADGQIINFGRYSDWIAPEKTPFQFTNTGYYYYCSHLLSKIAKILGNSQDAAEYAGLAGKIADAFNDEYFDRNSNKYISETSFSYVWPLFLDIVPGERKEAVLNNLLTHMRENWNGHISTGTLGTKYIFDVLVDNGHADVAYEMATKEDYPGWGYMLKNNATTLWELWENRTGTRMNSHNHIMLGAIGEWFYKHLAGIQMDPSAPGFRKATIKPLIVGDLTSAKGRVKTIRGMISSSWVRDGDNLKLKVTIPGNCDATVHIPTLGNSSVTVQEGDDVIYGSGSSSGSKDITYNGRKDGYIVFSLGSGSYHFTMKGKSKWDAE